MANSNWKKFSCSKLKLCLDTVLVCGQSFRWKKNCHDEWLGVMAGFVWRLKQTEDEILYQVYGKPNFTTNCSTKALHIDGSETYRLFEPKSIENVNKPRSENTHEKLSHQGTCINKNTLISSHPATEKTQTENSLTEKHLPSDEYLYTLLNDYFQLDVDIESLYKSWASKDPYFSQVAVNFQGVRMLRQDPLENLISFVCSSNNNISRISTMVENLCIHYGELITRVDDTDYYKFPTLSVLCKDDIETTLRQIGFGYRAKFIAKIAKYMAENKSENWLHSLRDKPYSEAKTELMTLYGVGSKVADCVCLMSLDKTEAVPVDTHVWQITMKHYMTKLQNAKSLTEKLYNEIGDFYRNLWGPYAGWAHSVLFTSDLRQNKRKGQGHADNNAKSIPCKKQKKSLKLK
ncbi:8-oxoguanine glycosylase ogg1 [Bulinus truncatus]|nr:8-oxoguanine glycosylase ogg1 [Bulinus truncatus]